MKNQNSVDLRHLINDKVVEQLQDMYARLLDIYAEFGLHKTAKQLSEDVSGLLETVISKHIEGAIAPKTDHEPDILYYGKRVEIKTTNGDKWRGGTFSKRPGYYIFVKVETVDEQTKFYIAGIHLEESDWVEVKSPKYYATFYTKKELFANRDSVTNYVGNIEQILTKLGKFKGLKVITE